MSTLFLKDLLVYAVLLAFVLYITRINNMWGVRKGVTKAKVDIKKEKDLLAKRNMLIKLLNHCKFVAENVGFKPSEEIIIDYKYKIDRLRLKLKLLDRNIKPIELVGALKTIKYVGLFIGTVGLIASGSILFTLAFLTLTFPTLFKYYAEMMIADEDVEIEQDFPDLYLLLYSRLVRGAYTRLSPTLEDFISSIDIMHNDSSHKALRNFVLDLRNNIEIYGDDSIAIYKMRETYKSAMIINFCNLAVQAMSGVNNSDKLLAFKVELAQKRMEGMKKRAELLVEKGQRAVMAIFLILFQFVALSWYAKLGGNGSMFSNFLN